MKVIYDLRLAEITSVPIEVSSSQLDPVILKGTSLICSSALSVQVHAFPSREGLALSLLSTDHHD